MSAYHSVLSLLESVRLGDADAFQRLISDCRAQLHAGVLRRWARAGAPDSTGRWLSELDTMGANRSPRGGVIETLGGMCLIACAMPEYQDLGDYWTPGVSRSPNFVMLGDSDGGLYGRLADDDAWFDTLFSSVFDAFDRDHGFLVFGMALALFPRADVDRLNRLAAGYVVRPDLSDDQSRTVERLLALTANVIADDGVALGVHSF